MLLILLGLELLYYNAKYKADRVRYDFMSTFLCALIFVGAFGCVFGVKYAELGWARTAPRRGCPPSGQQNLADALAGREEVSSLYANAYYQDKWQLATTGSIPDTIEGAKKSGLALQGHVSVTLAGPYASKAEFLAACDELRGVIASCGIDQPAISFDTMPASETNPWSTASPPAVRSTTRAR